MSKLIFVAVVFALAVGVARAAHAPIVDPAPIVDISSVAALPMLDKKPYEAKANADAAIDVAFERARKSGKRVLIDLGGNWCPDCLVVANVMRLRNVKPFVAAHYEVAFVDVGRFDKNLQVLLRFGIREHLEYVPSVLVADPNGELVNGGNFSDLADARNMTPQAIVDWLAKWTK
jgi:hypothetical protein